MERNLFFRRQLFFVFGFCVGAGSVRPACVHAADSVEIRFMESYNGPHPQEFADLLAQVKAIVPAALAYITDQWGLPNTLHHPMIVTITDIPSKDPSRVVAAYVRCRRGR